MAIIILSFADILWKKVNYRENNVQMYQLWKLQHLFMSFKQKLS